MPSVADPGVLQRLLTRLGRLEPSTPRRWGTLTPGEMLCHLGDAAENVLGSAGSTPGRTRRLYKFLALYSPLPWPHGLKTPPEVDPRARGTRPGNFETDRDRAGAGLRALAAAPDSAFPPGHGQLGRMLPRDWRYWAYRHTDHHLRQFGL